MWASSSESPLGHLLFTSNNLPETNLLISAPINQSSLNFSYIGKWQLHSPNGLGHKPYRSDHSSASHAILNQTVPACHGKHPVWAPVTTRPVGCESFDLVSLLLFLSSSDLFSTQCSVSVNMKMLSRHPHLLLKIPSSLFIPQSKTFLALSPCITGPQVTFLLAHCPWAIPVGLLCLRHTVLSSPQQSCTHLLSLPGMLFPCLFHGLLDHGWGLLLKRHIRRESWPLDLKLTTHAFYALVLNFIYSIYFPYHYVIVSISSIKYKLLFILQVKKMRLWGDNWGY